ncbi:MAG TPA: hypothetical protein VLS94_10155, partial [Fusibacter sp.]|nr:hypothetical protein [Fusibacter sp.]
QYACNLGIQGNMKQHFKTRFPALNVSCRNEPVAKDTVYLDVPAINDVSMCAQFFVERDSLVCDIYGMKTDKEFVNTLEDNIRKRGAMDKLVSDRAQAEISAKVKSILRALVIDDWQSEPHHQHQNYAERQYQTVKACTNIILNPSGAPAKTWLLCLGYVCFLTNHLETESLGWKTPMQVFTGETSDVSPLLHFQFYEEVNYMRHSSDFPSDSTEETGYFVGFGESVGDTMTFKILSKDTNKIMYRSSVRSATKAPNLRISPEDGEMTKFIQSRSEDTSDSTAPFKPLPGFHPNDLIDRTFVELPDDEGTGTRFKIIKALADNKATLDKHPSRVKFLVESTDNHLSKLIAYNNILEYLEKDRCKDVKDLDEEMYTFNKILEHYGPLKPSDKSYKGSKYNLLIEWKNGELTEEPLTIIGADDPVSVAMYAKENDLLKVKGWKQFKRYIDLDANLCLSINKHMGNYGKIKIKFGYAVPTNHDQAVCLDNELGNKDWQNAAKTEIDSLWEYEVFNDLGKDNFPPSS